jgi:cell division protein FtsW
MGQHVAVANTSQRSKTKSDSVLNVLRFKFDVPLVLVTITMSILGLIMVFSSSWDVSIRMDEPPTYFVIRHVGWLAIGGVGMLVLSLIDYHSWRRLVLLGMGVAIFLLVAVLVVGDETLGSLRSLGDGSYRPSELAKLVIVVYLAVWLYAKREQLSDVSFGLVPLGMILGVVGGLILRQPDLSAAATIVILGGIMFYLAGGDLKQIALLVIIVLLFGWIVVAYNPTGSHRVDEFVAGWKDPLMSSDHVKHALGAIVQGGWFGVGIGRSTTKLTSLPVPHTDSVFAVICEETGILGAIVVICLFGILLWRGLSVARRAPDGLGSLLAAGLTIWITMEAFFSMLALTNLMPFAGNSLPFFSVGGSNLVFTMFAIGIVLNISRLSEQKQQENERRSISEVVDLRGRNGRRRVSRTRRSRPSARQAP